jgi:hypothetical protein
MDPGRNMGLAEKIGAKIGIAVASKKYLKDLSKEERKALEKKAYKEVMAEMKYSSSGSTSRSSGSSGSSGSECCANCVFFEIGDTWGHHGAYTGGGGCCSKGGQRRVIFSTDEMHYDDAHKKSCCSYFSRR